MCQGSGRERLVGVLEVAFLVFLAASVAGVQLGENDAIIDFLRFAFCCACDVDISPFPLPWLLLQFPSPNRSRCP